MKLSVAKIGWVAMKILSSFIMELSIDSGEKKIKKVSFMMLFFDLHLVKRVAFWTEVLFF